MVIGVDPTHKERTGALLIRVWREGDPESGQQVLIRIAARADLESGEQQSAVFCDAASAHDWIGRWLSDVVTRHP
jgi:hypothetical protein